MGCGKFSGMVLLIGCLVIMGPERPSSKVIVIFQEGMEKEHFLEVEVFPPTSRCRLCLLPKKQ